MSEQLLQALRSQHVAQRCLRQQPRAVRGIRDVSDRENRLEDAEVQYSVYRHCHTVFGEDLQKESENLRVKSHVITTLL